MSSMVFIHGIPASAIFRNAENADVIRRYAVALRPGGRLLIDQVNRENMLRNFKTSGGWGNVITRNKWNPRTQRIESEWIVKNKGKSSRNQMSLRLYTHGQMRNIYEKAELRIEKTYGSMDGESYRRSSKRLIVVGRK